MRVMLDTNILISAIFFPSIQTRSLVSYIVTDHELVLCDYVLEELRIVVERKFSAKRKALETFLSSLQFELLHTVKDIDYRDIPSVRDNKDTPILVAAIQHDVDVFVTGDNDFLVLDIAKPLIMNMTEFLLRYS